VRQSKLMSSAYSLNDSDQVDFFQWTFKTKSTTDSKWQNSKLHHPEHLILSHISFISRMPMLAINEMYLPKS